MLKKAKQFDWFIFGSNFFSTKVLKAFIGFSKALMLKFTNKLLYQFETHAFFRTGLKEIFAFLQRTESAFKWQSTAVMNQRYF